MKTTSDAHARQTAVWLMNEAATAADHATARWLALPVVAEPPARGFYLARDVDGLALHRADDARAHPVRCDLAEAVAQRARGVRQSPLARACGLRRAAGLHVLDSTAGLARDSAALAAAGCTVQMIERHPVLHALLADAHARLDGLEHATSATAWAMRLAPPVHADAAAWLADQPAGDFDVIYMDPMFESPRRKAKPQKALAWLADLAGHDGDADTLLAAARAAGAGRVVVKQHARAKPLAPPSHQVEARAVRFDVYLGAPATRT
ncbi:class I SAM-dependent methyltransferase [Salinisphaera sp. Q1T1-3]|uniref:class I SAM-dependent methyltransferase n=1 Tax=Salinisphaera sp. Q1T1-3 TaxID=2321229 RepID=UPI0013145E6C|nr:class I SAM-dependent methyltransferase [Salinisphaera sp. Q1T1-3]